MNVLVTRRDFVAEYLGQTAIKTRKMLENNIGNTLIFEEPLIFGPEDIFGYEALSTINSYERSSEITIKFNENMISGKILDVELK
jgi:hypothetical protein